MRKRDGFVQKYLRYIGKMPKKLFLMKGKKDYRMLKQIEIIRELDTGKNKFQLSTLIGSFYSISVSVLENENNLYVEYFNIRQQKQINIVQNLCDYFNPKHIKLNGKLLIFFIKK